MRLLNRTKDGSSMLGWAVFACLASLLLASGFQATSEKTAVVDLDAAIRASELGKQNSEGLERMRTMRETLLQFIDANRVLTNEQAQRLHELWMKETPTEAEKAELERLKADIVAAGKRSQELAAKPNLTPEERTLLEDYARRSQTMDQVSQRWYRDFIGEMDEYVTQKRVEGERKAREAMSAIAKAEGYTVVFERQLAPYGANDLTEATTQALNAQQ